MDEFDFAGGAEHLERSLAEGPPIPGFKIWPYHLGDGDFVVRGGQGGRDYLATNLESTLRATNGRLRAVSAMAGIDRTVEDLLESKPTPGASICVTRVGALRDAGFGVLPTGRPPHCSILIPSGDEQRTRLLLTFLSALLQPPIPNPRRPST